MGSRRGLQHMPAGRSTAWTRVCGALLCGLWTIASGCGASTRGAVQGERRHFAAAGATSASYDTSPRAGLAVRGPHRAALGEALSRAGQAARELTPDARLGDLAQWVAAALDAGGAPPPAPVIELWTRQLGLVEPTPHLLVLGDGRVDALQARVRSELQAAVSRQRYSHFGIATLDRDGGVFAVVVLSFRFIELKPLPRSVATGESVQLQGKLVAGLQDAELVVSYPDGTSYRAAGPRGARVSLPVPLRGAGAHRVEVLAQSRLGITVVANFPLYVGMPPVTAIDVEPVAQTQWSEAQAQARSFELLNEARARAHLPALTRDAALDKIARAHSADMAEHGFVGHTSPTTGGAEQRVARAGVRSSLVLENIGRAYSPQEVHQGLMDSPGHRANVLHATASTVGIGVVIEHEDDRSVYLVTQLFVRKTPTIDPPRARDALRAAIDRARRAAGAPQLTHDGALSKLCAEAARDYFAGRGAMTREQLLARLNRAAGAAGARFSSLTALVTVVDDVAAAAELGALLDPRARALGLGVAQGTRVDAAPNAIAVVGLIGY